MLKSKGTQYYSYTYVANAVAGLLTCMLEGKNGEAYNIADIPWDIQLKDSAGIIARLSGTKVVFELPDEKERAGYSTATKSSLDGSKIKKLGWFMHYNIEHGIKRTLEMLRKA